MPRKPSGIPQFCPAPGIKVIEPAECIPTGSTMLNLVCSGHPRGGVLRGVMMNTIGDSSAGKTLLLLTMMAEAAKTPHLDGYSLIHDEPEAANEFDIPALFGQKVADRIEPPSDDSPWSETIEQFYYHADQHLAEPCIYGLDSMDALESLSSLKGYEEARKKVVAGEEPKGTYGDGKAKVNSQNLRKLCRVIKTAGSMLMIISQTRDNIGIGFAPKTRAGGRALKFYASYEIWLAVKGKIKKTIKGKPREIGTMIACKMTKNKVTGAQDVITFPVLYNYGVDDTTSCIDYLLEEGVWTKAKSGLITVHGLAPLEGAGKYPDALAEAIEKSPELVTGMQNLVANTWHDVRHAMSAVGRMGKYE